MANINLTLRIAKANWSFGPGVDPNMGGGGRDVLCYHFDDGNGNFIPAIPGPTIRGNVGDVVTCTIQNRIDTSGLEFVDSLKTGAIVHWHGLELGNAHDGTPVTQRPIAQGDDFVYRFKLHRPGVYWYHPHFDGLLQEYLGCYGMIVVDDAHSNALRAARGIPHADRTWDLTLSDISFQSGRATNPPAAHVPLANLPATQTAYVRDLHHISGQGGTADQQMGDVFLVNGHHQAAFNTAAGNDQQLTGGAQSQQAAAITMAEGESFAFNILNAGVHRAYKIEMMTRVNNGPWQPSNDLVWIGGQAGLLDAARGGGGATFGGWKLTGRKTRGNSPQVVQANTDLSAGEFALVNSARITVAGTVPTGQNVTHIGLRARGFSVVASNQVADTNPTDMMIAEFAVSGNAQNQFTLANPLVAGTVLRPNQADKLEDLRSVQNVVTAWSGCTKAQLDQGGVPVPSGAISTGYSMAMTGQGVGPSIDNVQHHFHTMGAGQPTPDSTRYLRQGDVVEWVVENSLGPSDHPWHIHGFSFQPIKIELQLPDNSWQELYDWSDGNTDWVEYVDTMYIPARHRVTYRFRVDARKYIDEQGNEHDHGEVGRWLMHCHITRHAHRGMMSNFIVIGAQGCDFDERQHVDVYLRDNANDSGEEPSTGSISASPDIRIHKTSSNPADAFGPQSGTEAEFGQNNFVFARVHNRGNRVARAATDIYWSEVSTLVTPDQWNHIGRTGAHTVNPGGNSVSNALTWDPQDDGAGPGHYCFVGVTGSEQDMRPISPQSAATFPAFATFDDFRDLIRNHNNVTWRNFNIVDAILNFAPDSEKKARFKFPGAFDRPRLFDLVIENPFERALLELPMVEEIVEPLARADMRMKVDEKRRRVLIPLDRGRMVLPAMTLSRMAAHRAAFVIGEDAKGMIGQRITVAQRLVLDRKTEVRRLKLQIDEAFAMPKGVVRLERLRGFAERLKVLERGKEEEAREEVGRVTWAFVHEDKGWPEDDAGEPYKPKK